MVLSKDCSLWDVLHPCVCSGVDCFYISRFLNELDYLEVVLFQDSGICDWQQQIFFTLIWYSSSTGHGYQVWYSGKSKEKITIQCGERTTFIPSYNVDVVDELLRSMNLCDTFSARSHCCKQGRIASLAIVHTPHMHFSLLVYFNPNNLNFSPITIIHLNLFRKELFACYKDLAYSIDRKWRWWWWKDLSGHMLCWMEDV